MENHGLTDENLRAAYQRALAARAAPERERCASPEDLLAVIRKDGPEAKRLATLDHVMGCRACRPEFDLLRSIEEASAEPAEAPRRRWGWAPSLALAAALVLGIGAALELSGKDGGTVERGGGDPVTLVAPPAEIDAGAPVTFSWQPVPGASRYQLELLDEKGAVVFAKTTEATSTTLDETTLAPGATYRWWVRATVGSAEPRASSMRSLRLRAK
jgi:hypothetical protein